MNALHTTSCATVDSPIGPIHITSDGTALVGLRIEGSVSPRPEGHTCSARGDRVLSATEKQLGQYFAGKRTSFDLPLAPSGTTFQEAVWGALAKIPFGETNTYGELGARAGRPGAGRAVGGCVGRNPIPIVIPCHRVLGTDQRITGFSGGNGISTKEWLLEHEGIEFRN
jgi:methylated-DNA-[protein]-cysteine S-methyltransferase